MLVALAVTAGLLSSPTPDNNQGFRKGSTKLTAENITGKLTVIKGIYKGKIAVGIDLKPFRGKAGRRIRTT